TVTNLQGLEWEIAEKLTTISRDLKAKELISIEGVASQSQETNAYYYACSPDIEKKFDKIKVQPLKEGIIMGVTSALLLKARCPVSAIFVETHSGLPDSRAAAKAIEVLDKYLGLKIDYKPLLEKAAKFESKIKKILEDKEKMSAAKENKELTYLG
ncbi:MAG: PAC2 family protein, partial [Nanoarchaeota archaeon]